ncbi:MAG TPA: class I SAM-dependent methyltransferase [Acidiferrobacteraceae bacterium]|nr:class I SAM-dependent methyltransferase [Acidiferrobacteraceae bacterium]
MIGAQAIGRNIMSSSKYVNRAVELLSVLTPDDYSDYMSRYYLEGKRRFGEAWGYADIVTTVLGLTDMIKPKRYLEIGVRRGRSACAVVSRALDCELALFDMWVENYAGMDNPGPEFVREELKRVGHKGKVEFINGNSHQTLPAYFQSNPDVTFDMITVDGDHTNVGAAQDLADVLPRVSIGGVVIFDDVCHPKLLGLGEVWRRQVVEDRRFSAWTYSDVGYGVGFAIRKI